MRADVSMRQNHAGMLGKLSSLAPGQRACHRCGKLHPFPGPMPFTETEKFCDVIGRAVVARQDCPALGPLGILDAGITHVGSEWCFVRLAPPFSLVLVTVAGRGAIICDGRWQEVGPDTAYVMPAGGLHGYRAADGDREWRYAWVRFETAAKFPSLFQSPDARTFSAASYSLLAANSGLIAEVARSNDPQLVGLWCELLQASLHHLVRPGAVDPRLANLWTAVNERLGEPWDIDRMAGHANLSREHLRRLCHRHYGCSPRQRLTTLRMRRACEFLMLAEGKLAAVAGSIGFSDPFSFSQAFKREFGISPSVYRQRVARSDSVPGVA